VRAFLLGIVVFTSVLLVGAVNHFARIYSNRHDGDVELLVPVVLVASWAVWAGWTGRDVLHPMQVSLGAGVSTFAAMAVFAVWTRSLWTAAMGMAVAQVVIGLGSAVGLFGWWFGVAVAHLAGLAQRQGRR
jgi:hypothetical protein